MGKITSIKTISILSVLPLALFLFCTESRSDITKIKVTGSWVRAAPPGAMMMGGYFVITNNARDKTVTLVSFSSPKFKEVMMHQTEISGGIARMKHVEELVIKPGKTVKFEPGGYHLMLMQPAGPLKVGSRIPIKMRFKSNEEKTVNFTVRHK